MPKSFDSAKDIPDLSDKVILVTGGNAGIGEATVRALVPHNPACIYLCARKTAAGEAVMRSIRETHPKANITLLTLDLASLSSVKACAEDFNRQADRLDVLFLNAGEYHMSSTHLTASAAESSRGRQLLKSTRIGRQQISHHALTDA
jgi:NAD(P)-dependent dehydrogenase (short-subunit alcohol dehydrogenase family)